MLTLNVDIATTQLAPPNTMAAMVSQVDRLSAVMVTQTISPAKDNRARPSTRKKLRSRRHQALHRSGAEAEDEATDDDTLDRGRHSGVAQARAHGEAKRLWRQPTLGTRLLPPQKNEDETDVTRRVDGKGGGCACCSNDEAADRRADASCDIEAHRVQRDGRGQIFPRHHFAD
jgi:hypothetical protein